MKLVNESLDQFLNESDAVLLRTMTRKSKFQFGKFKDLTVQEVIDLRKYAYLRQVYYNLAGISFSDDILKTIGVFGDNFDNRIKKPGINIELGKQIFKEKYKSANTNTKKYLKRNNLAAENKFNHLDKQIFSKQHLQRFNQGKK